MPLTPSAEREELHLRRIELRGFQRKDGLFDIEGHLRDTKSQQVTRPLGTVAPAGTALHEMWIRLVIDRDFVVRAVEAVTDHSPHAVCKEATASLDPLVGARIGRGFNRRVRELLGGAKGCTHLTELLPVMATAAIQAMWPVRAALPVERDANGRPTKIDSCWAYASHREVVAQIWPEHHDGAARRASS